MKTDAEMKNGAETGMDEVPNAAEIAIRVDEKKGIYRVSPTSARIYAMTIRAPGDTSMIRTENGDTRTDATDSERDPIWEADPDWRRPGRRKHRPVRLSRTAKPTPFFSRRSQTG
ncbi:hypothetical protein [Halostagnicola bangensis]